MHAVLHPCIYWVWLSLLDKTDSLVLLVRVHAAVVNMHGPAPAHFLSRCSLHTQKPVSVLELRAVLVLVHVQCHLAALLHHALAVRPVSLQRLQARLPADGAQGLGALVPHHGVLAGPLQRSLQLRNASLVLHLAQHVGHLVAEQGTATLETWWDTARRLVYRLMVPYKIEQCINCQCWGGVR